MPANARVLALNVRRSTIHKGPSWTSRRNALLESLRAVPGGVPGILLLSECTREQQAWLMGQLGYLGFGNGIDPRSADDRDRSADNVCILWDPADYDEHPDARRIAWSGPAIDRDYVRSIRLNRAGQPDTWAWFTAVHPQAGLSFEAIRVLRLRQNLTLLEASGVDMSRHVLGGDLNSAVRYPSSGLRTMLRKEWALADIVDLLSADAFSGNSWSTFHGWKPTRKTGRHIDAVLVTPAMRVRHGSVHRTDIRPADLVRYQQATAQLGAVMVKAPTASKASAAAAGTDHSGVLAGITLTDATAPQPEPVPPEVSPT